MRLNWQNLNESGRDLLRGRAWLRLDAVAQEGPHENKRPSEGDAANEPDRVWAKDGA